jgi:hypothetical protein
MDPRFSRPLLPPPTRFTLPLIPPLPLPLLFLLLLLLLRLIALFVTPALGLLCRSLGHRTLDLGSLIKGSNIRLKFCFCIFEIKTSPSFIHSFIIGLVIVVGSVLVFNFIHLLSLV